MQQLLNTCEEQEETSGEIGAIPFAMKSSIRSVGCWVPPTVVKTEDIEAEIRHVYPYRGFSLAGVTGVLERRFSEDGGGALAASLRAVEALQEKSPFDYASIDVLIFAGVSRDYIEPAMATVIARELGIQTTVAFDVSNACLGFVDALLVADSLISTKRCSNALVVSAEFGSNASKNALRAIKSGESFYHNFAALTLGDGAAAALIQPMQPGNTRCIAGIRASFPEYSDSCVIPMRKPEELEMYTDPKRLFAGALKHIPELYKSLAGAVKWLPSDIDALIPHQASSKIILEGAHSVQIAAEKVVSTIERFGNLASVSIPFTLAHALSTGRLTAGKKAMVAGFGSGLGIGLIALRG